jgi:hypothetical protein
MKVVRCVCGGWIGAEDDLEAKRKAVAEHNQSLLHVVWRWYNER